MVTVTNALFSLKDTELSQIEIFWISKMQVRCNTKMEILPKTFSDHNPVTLTYKRRVST